MKPDKKPIQETKSERPLLNLGIEIIKSNGRPGIQFRKVITDKKKITEILSRVFLSENNTILAEISFKDKFSAAAKLKEKGLI